MSNLARAIAVAAQAHVDQRDKSGAPYILHSLRIMLRMGTEEEMMVAVLHDVVEDTDWTIDKLRWSLAPPARTGRSGWQRSRKQPLPRLRRCEYRSTRSILMWVIFNPPATQSDDSWEVGVNP